jgi:hypothetical protein
MVHELKELDGFHISRLVIVQVFQYTGRQVDFVLDW